jgi:hypothetical protein
MAFRCRNMWELIPRIIFYDLYFIVLYCIKIICWLMYFFLLLHAPLLGVILHALLLYLQLQSLGQLH